jgi:magnesium transporter
MVKFLLDTQLGQLPPFMDAHLLSHIENGQVNKFDCFSEASLISFDWYDIRDVDSRPAKIVICFTRENVFFICEGADCLARVVSLAGEEPTDNRVLYVFFTELIKSDIDHLEELEEQITENEGQVISNYKSFKTGYTEEIICMRRELLKLKRYYEQLNQIFEGLMENENGLISAEDLRYFRILDSKIDRLFAHVLNLRDYVTQVREAYQAQIDIEQNNLMKIFTVVTSIFLPLTLLVGWYGMNIKMPEFSWDYGYPFVAALSVLVVIALFIFFKRRKWF